MPRRPGDPWLWAVCAAVFAVYVVLSVSRYAVGNPASWDLGIFTEAVRHYAHFQAPVVDIRGMDAMGDHFSPVDALFLPAWWLAPSPVTLLVVQAALAAVSIVPVYRAAAARLTVVEARLVAAAYGFSWGLASMAWYDVHEIAFAVPLIACSLSAMARSKHRAVVWWAVPLVFVKEDQGFTVVAIGLALALVYGKRLAGALLAAWGVGWSLLAVYVLIPDLNPGHAYPYWSQDGHLAGLAAGWDVKGPTLVVLLLPTALVALRSPLAAIAVPSIALRFVSSNPAYWGTIWHYNATVMPILFVAAIDGLARIRAGRPTWARGFWPYLGQYAPSMMAMGAVTLALWSPLQNLWQPGTYKTPAHITAARAAEQMIPAGQTVNTTLPELAPLAARGDDVYYFNDRTAPQWILLDTASWNVPVASVSHFPGFTYRTLFHRDGVVLEQRISAHR
ncbi:DUF2079 domain-containing protein [Streptomyces sp. RB6PN25]|uniref:DUF2079 domain-containing protein n=1 Tax=Streptomyces humicola TaxID=2953240 RepID=A0ABT1PW53_9ACTN|nr:DUF2079 domain-containing protein [Streptomyces humicola]MCQ4080765.1 DUF2079 domain-containing protein [Streptomyces humicola]